jgi:hypothetical protein
LLTSRRPTASNPVFWSNAMQYAFPPRGERLDPSWFAPLLLVERVLRDNPGLPSDRFFDAHDFMIMERVLRRGRPDLWLYKHSLTRRYINLDDAGHAYRYYPPRSPDSKREGLYRAHRNLRDALRPLDLVALPWMKAGLEAFRCGVAWNDRWQLIDDDTGDLFPMPQLRVPDFSENCPECQQIRDEAAAD